ncbi:aquaporin [Periconia macrospinosa]|uniref:Aquaporin n=1 Tax=Periconia macrospinosa TaxID=97972 RepID=A0A2V1DQ05_9PLEO|nr:aquaporin [Periconia macrospinosa]
MEEPPQTKNFGEESPTRFQLAPRSPSSSPKTDALHTISTAHSTLTKGVSLSEGEKSSTTLRRSRTLLGLPPAAPLLEDHDYHDRQKLLWSRIRIALREPFAEFWGVVIMILFGDGSVAQVLLSTGQTGAPGGNGFGAYQSISWGWGLGVMLGIYVAGDSGAYLNPAITFCSCLFRQLPWRRFPVYFIAQVLGAFVGSGIVYAVYYPGIDYFEGGPGVRTVPPAKKATAGIFCTYPQAFLNNGQQFVSEFVASAILMFVIFALKDPGNNGIGKSDKWFPLCIFFLIFGLGACFGWETGYAINLARDFGPRLMSYAVGYGSEVWSAGSYYFWVSKTNSEYLQVPMVAPFVGCAFGGFLYDLFIFTGPSPVNTPWIGLKLILSPKYAMQSRKERHDKYVADGIV